MFQISSICLTFRGKRKYVKRTNIFLLFFLLCSCQIVGLNRETNEDRAAIERMRAEQDSYLTQIEMQLNSPEIKGNETDQENVLEKKLRDFLQKNPNSVFLDRALLDLGIILEKKERWQEALETLKALVEKNGNREITALALVHSAKIFEALNEDVKILVSLKDLDNYLENLPQQIALVEVPVMRAAVYYRIGQKFSAEQQLTIAQEGIQKLRLGLDNPQQREWLAVTYYKMGQFPLNQLLEGNIDAFLDTLSVVQIFSLHGVEMGLEPWSSKAEDQIKLIYRKAWNSIINQSTQSEEIIPSDKLPEKFGNRNLGIKPSVDGSLYIQEEKIRLLSKLLEKMEELKAMRMPENSPQYLATNEVFSFIDSLKKEIQIKFQTLSIRNPLTPESEKLRGLQR